MGPSSLSDAEFSKRDLGLAPQEISKEFDSVSDSRPSDEKLETVQVSSKSESRYLTGPRLFLVTSAVTLVCFLVLLDTAIIVTACLLKSRCPTWAGTVALIKSRGVLSILFLSSYLLIVFQRLSAASHGQNLYQLQLQSKFLLFGSSGLMNGALTIISGSAPMHRVPALFGMMMGFCQLGVAFGPLIGGAFTEYSSWRWCFYINLPVGGIVALMLLFIDIPDQIVKPSIKSSFDSITRKLDLIGFALFSPAAIQLLLALEYGQNEFGWTSATVIGLFCGSGCTFFLFLAWEYRQGDRAMVPLSMLVQRVVWSSCLVMLAIFAMTLTASYYLPIYFQSVREKSPLMSGVYILPSILSQLAFAVISGLLVGKLGYYLPWAMFCGIATAIGYGLLSTLSPNTSTEKWIGYQIILGAGRGAGFQIPLIAIQNTLSPSQLSTGMAILMFIQTLSGSIFLTLANVIFSAGLKNLIPQDAPNANVDAIVAAGATGMREVISSEDLPGVLHAYAESIDRIFYMAAGLGVVCLVFSFGMGWKDIRKKNSKPSGENV